MIHYYSNQRVCNLCNLDQIADEFNYLECKFCKLLACTSVTNLSKYAVGYDSLSSILNPFISSLYLLYIYAYLLTFVSSITTTTKHTKN